MNYEKCTATKYSPYSFSRISSFDSCPKKFEFAYIIKPEIEKKSSLPLDRGSYIHHCLERYPNKPYMFFNLPEDKIVECNTIIDNFLNSDIGKSIFNEINLGKEIDFGLFKNFKLSNFNDSMSLLRGSIDRLNIADDNSLHVVDYKSGKYKEEQYQSYKQIMLYAIWIFRNPVFDSVEYVKGSYVYVEQNNVNSKTFYRSNILEYINEYANSIKQIESSEVFKKKETRLCDWCEFKKYCDELNLIF